MPAAPATLTALVWLEGDRFRLVAAESENLHRPALDDLQARATALGTT